MDLIRPINPLMSRRTPLALLAARTAAMGLFIPGMRDTSDASLRMLQGDRTYSFDANNVLSDNAAAYTANGYLQAGGADGIIDLGGNQGVTITLPSIADSTTLVPQQARIDAMCVLDVTAIDIASNDERYTFKILGCNNPAFTSGVAELAAIGLGKGSSGTPNTQGNSVIGRYELPFTNEQANVKYQWIKGYLVVAGTTPSISVFAFVAVLPEP